MKEISVLVGVPSGGDWKPSFGMSLLNMVLRSQYAYKNIYQVDRLSVHNAKGSILSRNRTSIVQAALEGRFTHILFVDDDMTFPADTLLRLLSSGKSVIACNCPTKMLPSTCTARDKGPEHYGVPVTNEDRQGTSQVWRIGTGIMLVSTRVFRGLPHPWFPVMWNPAINDFVGEDWAFCEKLENAGIPIYVDFALSAEIGHCGTYEFKHSDIPLRNQNGNSD